MVSIQQDLVTVSDRPLSVALVADTHGYLDPRVAQTVARCHCAIHAGDVGSGAILRSLRPRSGKVVAVRGNNDVPAKWPQSDLDVLARLSAEGALELPGGRVVVVHGHRAGSVAQRHARLRKRYPHAKIIVYGHTHRLVMDQTTEPWVLNPGAAGRARTYGGPSCLILYVEPAEWKVDACRFEPLSRATRTHG